MKQEQFVVCLAGRRVDSVSQIPPSFPLSHVELVEQRLREVIAPGARELVSSAACGVDLLGIKVALELDIAFSVVLPSDPDDFKNASVLDRPGEWLKLFDLAISTARRCSRLLVLETATSDRYEEVNRMILRKGQELANGGPILALAVWDQRPHQGKDHTLLFMKESAALGIQLSEISTL